MGNCIGVDSKVCLGRVSYPCHPHTHRTLLGWLPPSRGHLFCASCRAWRVLCHQPLPRCCVGFFLLSSGDRTRRSAAREGDAQDECGPHCRRKRTAPKQSSRFGTAPRRRYPPIPPSTHPPIHPHPPTHPINQSANQSTITRMQHETNPNPSPVPRPSLSPPRLAQMREKVGDLSRREWTHIKHTRLFTWHVVAINKIVVHHWFEIIFQVTSPLAIT